MAGREKPERAFTVVVKTHGPAVRGSTWAWVAGMFHMDVRACPREMSEPGSRLNLERGLDDDIKWKAGLSPVSPRLRMLT